MAEMKAIPSTPYEVWGHAGTAAILVLQPLEDAAAASGGRMLHETFSDRVTLVDVANAGHALLPEQLALISREVRSFLHAH
jgi:hypothetical protein